MSEVPFSLSDFRNPHLLCECGREARRHMWVKGAHGAVRTKSFDGYCLQFKFSAKDMAPCPDCEGNPYGGVPNGDSCKRCHGAGKVPVNPAKPVEDPPYISWDVYVVLLESRGLPTIHKEVEIRSTNVFHAKDAAEFEHQGYRAIASMKKEQQ